MSFDFIRHENTHEPMVFFISDGSYQSDRTMKQLSETLTSSLPDASGILAFSNKDREGAQVCDFYNLMTLPAVLIVREDDQIYHGWYGHEIPHDMSVIRHSLEQAGRRMHGH